MNKYFIELFDGFREEEHWLIGDMIIRVGEQGLSFYYWSETLSEKEKDFVIDLVHKVDTEFYSGIVADSGWTELAVFAEIMVYYTVYDSEFSVLMPNIGLFYAEAVKSLC